MATAARHDLAVLQVEGRCVKAVASAVFCKHIANFKQTSRVSCRCRGSRRLFGCLYGSYLGRQACEARRTKYPSLQ